MKLLIVDDSNLIRNKIFRVISDTRLNFMTIVGLAEDGEKALDIFVKQKPDVVTMDLTMPNMDGVQCIEAMMRLNPNVNILVVSALSDRTTAIKALKNGAKGFIYKPFTDEQLSEALLEVTS